MPLLSQQGWLKRRQIHHELCIKYSSQCSHVRIGLIKILTETFLATRYLMFSHCLECALNRIISFNRREHTKTVLSELKNQGDIKRARVTPLPLMFQFLRLLPINFGTLRWNAD